MISDSEWHLMLQLGCDEVSRDGFGFGGEWAEYDAMRQSLYIFLVEPFLACQACSLQLAMFQHKVT